MIDIVITYVDGRKEQWLKEWTRRIGQPIPPARFRDWGTLPFLLRGIESHMRFVRRVFLVVSDVDQVPDYIDRETVAVVTHREFIPKWALPTFNSNVIETFLSRIDGLSEQFIYFNDDLFPLSDMSEGDFFTDGKINVQMKTYTERPATMFRNICRNAWRMACGLAGKPVSLNEWSRPQHAAMPMLKSVNDEILDTVLFQSKIRILSTPVRDYININPYIFTDYAYLTGRAAAAGIKYKYVAISSEKADSIADIIGSATTPLVCLNDNCTCDDFRKVRETIISAFEKKFPKKSKYEIDVHSAGI